ncbi:MAG: pantothenate kinase, partial [Chloroflexi bacterium]|nr:pantothenate kinase [Chloroflexota bacterium]
YLNTSQLRRVELVAPDSAIGQNTTEALQSGLVLGYAGLVTGMVARFKKELGEDAKVVGTGGLADTMARVANVFDAINPDLTLIGLRLIYGKNQPPPKVLD